MCRYESLVEQGVAPFFYGTHYSTASIVLWFLIRLEPFTGLARAMQACHPNCVSLPLCLTWRGASIVLRLFGDL